MGPLDVLGLFGLSRRWRGHPKTCVKCQRFIKVGEGYRVTEDGFLHGRCADAKQDAKEGEPAASTEAPPG